MDDGEGERGYSPGMGLTGTRSDACMDLDSGAKMWGKAAEMLALIAFRTDTTGDMREQPPATGAT